MSTIKADNLQNRAGTASVPVDTVVAGSAKAWVNFNGAGTVAIRAAFNVSSITDNGVGNYTINFTSPMPDANYAVVVTGASSPGNSSANAPYATGAANTASNALIGSWQSQSVSTVIDLQTICAAVYR